MDLLQPLTTDEEGRGEKMESVPGSLLFIMSSISSLAIDRENKGKVMEYVPSPKKKKIRRKRKKSQRLVLDSTPSGARDQEDEAIENVPIPKKKKIRGKRKRKDAIKIVRQSDAGKLADLENGTGNKTDQAIGNENENENENEMMKDDEPMIELDVGSVAHNRRTFHINNKLLRTRVKYFSEIFQHHPMNVPLKLRLNQQEPISFALFVEWLYNGQYAPLNYDNGEIAFTTRLRLYCLATEFELPHLMDYTMNILIANQKRYKWHPSPKDTDAVYVETEPGSKLRFFVSRLWAGRLANDFMMSRFPKVYTATLRKRIGTRSRNGDFLLDVIRWLNVFKAEMTKRGRDEFDDACLESLGVTNCSFHVHDEVTVCPVMENIF